MTARIDYNKAAPQGLERMRELERYLNHGSGLDRGLLELVRLRASLMNGCEFCIDMHTNELKKLNETPDRIASLDEWRSSSNYSPRERAALAWTEVVTDIQDGHAPDVVYEQMREHFTEAEAVNLTLAITTINAWNRIAVSLGSHSGR